MAIKELLGKISAMENRILGPVLKWMLIAVAYFATTSFVSVYGPELHLQAIRKKVGDTVVFVYKNSEERSGGTGFHVKSKSGKTYIMTNSHVCQLAVKKPSEGELRDEAKPGQALLVKTENDERAFRKIVAVYEYSDLCLLEPISEDHPALNLAGQISAGDTIAAVGHPHLKRLVMTRGSVISEERISLLWGINVKPETCDGPTFRLQSVKDIKDPFMALFLVMLGIENLCERELMSISTNVNILPGSSGSPAVDFWGRLKGVMFAGDQNSWGYMVPLNEVKTFLDRY